MRLFAQDVLRGDGDARRFLGRSGDRLVIGIGVHGLEAAHDSGHGLYRNPRDVVQRLLLGEIDTGGLCVELEAPGGRILCTQALACQPRPNAPPGAEFGNFLEEADRDVEKEGEAPQHEIDVHAPLDAVLRILHGRREGEAHRLGRRRSRLLHVLADDGYRIPVRDVFPAEFDMVEEDAPRARKRQAIKHVVGDEMGEIIALVRGARDRCPRNPAPLRDAECEGKERERRRIVHSGGYRAERHAGQGGVHMLGRVDHGAASAEQDGIDFVAIDPAEA